MVFVGFVPALSFPSIAVAEAQAAIPRGSAQPIVLVLASDAPGKTGLGAAGAWAGWGLGAGWWLGAGCQAQRKEKPRVFSIAREPEKAA